MSIILTKSNGTSDVTYTLQKVEGSKSTFTNQAAGLTVPESFSVQHTLRPPASKGTDRHLLVINKAVIETTSLQYLVGSVSVQLNIPRSSDFTLAMMKDLIAQMTSYLNLTANVTALFNGATPEGDFNVTGPFNPSIA